MLVLRLLKFVEECRPAMILSKSLSQIPNVLRDGLAFVKTVEIKKNPNFGEAQMAKPYTLPHISVQ
jgi:hypothetical protein